MKKCLFLAVLAALVFMDSCSKNEGTETHNLLFKNISAYKTDVTIYDRFMCEIVTYSIYPGRDTIIKIEPGNKSIGYLHSNDDKTRMLETRKFQPNGVTVIQIK